MSKDIRSQVCSVPKNLLTLVRRSSNQALPFWLYSFVLLYFSIGYATQSIISYLQFTSTDLFYPLPIGATKIENKRVLKKILPEWCYFKNVNITYTNEQLVNTFKGSVANF
ncbi:hypothetical protein, partial [Kurthia sibirica]